MYINFFKMGHLFMLKIIFSVCLLLVASQSLAHGDHKHVTPIVAIDIANKATKLMAKQDVGLNFGKLAPSWAEVGIPDMDLVKDTKGFYVVSALNKSTQETLYLLVAKNGEVYDVNFSGDFEGITDKASEVQHK